MKTACAHSSTKIVANTARSISGALRWLPPFTGSVVFQIAAMDSHRPHYAPGARRGARAIKQIPHLFADLGGQDAVPGSASVHRLRLYHGGATMRSLLFVLAIAASGLDCGEPLELLSCLSYVTGEVAFPLTHEEAPSAL